MVRANDLRAVVVAAGLLLPTIATSWAQTDSTFCHQVNRIGAAAAMDRFSDREIMNALCLTTDLVLKAIVANNDPQQQVCLQATAHAMREFKRRFPSRDPAKAC